jgi:hypothetical protein
VRAVPYAAWRLWIDDEFVIYDIDSAIANNLIDNFQIDNFLNLSDIDCDEKIDTFLFRE